ncbi:MAG: ornithine cyclodeaminase family protein [Anaerolineae bacterium]
MTLLLRNHEIQGLMDLRQYIEAVEAGYREAGLGRGTNFPRQNLWIPGDSRESVVGGHLAPGAKASFKFKAALLPGLGGAGVQPYTAGLPGGLHTYLMLFDTDTGALAAIMEVLYYDWLKTAATAAVATKYLAPEHSTVVALFGTGRHARTQLHGLCAVRPIKRVQAYSRRPEPREAFCRAMSEELGIEAVPAASPAEALRGADIVTTMTTSPEPVFDGRLLEERPIHINAMGAHYPWAREIDEYVVLRSRIIVDEWKQALSEQGEVLIPMEQGLLKPSEIHGDLGQVVAGRVPGREKDTLWTLFLSGGTGIEDVAVGTRLYRAAKEKGVGTEFTFGQPFAFTL